MKFYNCLLCIFTLLKIFAIQSQGTPENCNFIFNASDFTSYWYLNINLTCQACPLDPSETNGYCPLYPGAPVIGTCAECVTAYCDINSPSEALLMCGE